MTNAVAQPWGALVKVTSVDPRDESWGDDAPVYRVYLWTDDGTSDEYSLAGVDVPDVLAWAERRARASRRTYSVMVEVRDHQRGPGLIRLAGWDPNAHAVSHRAARPAHAQPRPLPEAGLFALPGGASTVGAHVLEDRVYISLVVSGEVGLKATFAWR